MKTKLYFILLAGYFFLQRGELMAQAPNWLWEKSIGSANYYEQGYAIVVDASGNTYTTGYFASTVDFDPGPGIFNLSSQGVVSTFITKLNSSGGFVWAKSISGLNETVAQSMAIDSVGNLYLAGYFVNTIDIDPGPGIFYLTSNGNRDVFVLKLDSAGDFIWAGSMGGAMEERVGHITVDQYRQVYITGLFSGTAFFDPGSGGYPLVSAGLYDIFISKLDSSGNFAWAKRIGGAEYDFGMSTAVDTLSGEVYLTGSFRGSVDFDPDSAGTFNLVSAGNSDIYVTKLSSSGNFLWAVSMGDTMNDAAIDIHLDASGNVYTIGIFMGTVDFDPGPGIHNGSGPGVFISKLDGLGNYLWAKQMASPSAGGVSLTTDASGNVYTAGTFTGTVDFDPDSSGTFIRSGPGAFVSKLDSMGNFEWAKTTFGGSSKSIALDIAGNVYITGEFSGYPYMAFDTDTLLNSGGMFIESDIFIAKLNSLPTGIEDIKIASHLSVYPNPASGMIYIQTLQFKAESMEVFNLLGEKLYSRPLSANENQFVALDISRYSAGVYFLRVHSKNGTITKKILKQ